mgnify:FL=1
MVYQLVILYTKVIGLIPIMVYQLVILYTK